MKLFMTAALGLLLAFSANVQSRVYLATPAAEQSGLYRIEGNIETPNSGLYLYVHPAFATIAMYDDDKHQFAIDQTLIHSGLFLGNNHLMVGGTTPVYPWTRIVDVTLFHSTGEQVGTGVLVFDPEMDGNSRLINFEFELHEDADLDFEVPTFGKFVRMSTHPIQTGCRETVTVSPPNPYHDVPCTK